MFNPCEGLINSSQNIGGIKKWCKRNMEWLLVATIVFFSFQFVQLSFWKWNVETEWLPLVMVLRVLQTQCKSVGTGQRFCTYLLTQSVAERSLCGMGLSAADWSGRNMHKWWAWVGLLCTLKLVCSVLEPITICNRQLLRIVLSPVFKLGSSPGYFG